MKVAVKIEASISLRFKFSVLTEHDYSTRSNIFLLWILQRKVPDQRVGL